MSRFALLLIALALLLFIFFKPLAEDRLPALHEAAREGDVTRLQALLAGGAEPNKLAGHHPSTPLMQAVRTRQLIAVRALLEGGADPNQPMLSGFTPLMMAAGHGDAGMVRLLLAYGADPYASTPASFNALAAAVGGSTAFDDFTAGDCQIETVQALLEAAPDLRVPRGWAGRRARIAAALGRCTQVLELIDSVSHRPPPSKP